MTRSNRAADFLKNMREDLPPPASVPPLSNSSPPLKEPTTRQPAAGRSGLKHIGGYLDRETVEKVAILRARLNLDNSELIKLAVDELHSKHMAKRAFGDG
jgi:hypothetical protein